jgi:hypothetical protein
MLGVSKSMIATSSLGLVMARLPGLGRTVGWEKGVARSAGQRIWSSLLDLLRFGKQSGNPAGTDSGVGDEPIMRQAKNVGRVGR